MLLNNKININKPIILVIQHVQQIRNIKLCLGMRSNKVKRKVLWYYIDSYNWKVISNTKSQLLLNRT